MITNITLQNGSINHDVIQVQTTTSEIYGGGVGLIDWLSAWVEVLRPAGIWGHLQWTYSHNLFSLVMMITDEWN